MYEKIPIGHLSREAWLQLRKTGLGGSDAGAVCGLNPYSSAMKVFQDKTSDTLEEADQEAVRQGHDLEDYVAKRFQEAAGLKVRRSHFLYRSVEHPCMIADVDRLVVGEDAGLECKTTNAYQAEKWADGKIPLHYLLQCYHYMAVTGKRTWYLAVLILGRDFLYHRLEWEEELIRQMIQEEEYFWKQYVEQRQIPPPDGSRTCEEVLEQYFHRAKKASEIKLVGFDGKLERREEIVSLIAGLQEEQKQIEQEVKLFMKDYEVASSEKFRVQWSNVDMTRLDTKRVRQEHPEIYQDCAKVSTSRRFQVKAA